MKILLMEDDAVLSDILLDYLRESWEVDAVRTMFYKDSTDKSKNAYQQSVWQCH